MVACPDGTYGGRDLFCEPHSLYINGLGGRFEDHVFQEVIPFLMANYAIRPEREAPRALGTSAGGYGAMSLAIRHRDSIGAVATLAAPLNLRYSNVDGDYFEDFNPATYRWKTRYDPDEVIGRLLLRPAAGPRPEVHHPGLRRRVMKRSHGSSPPTLPT